MDAVPSSVRTFEALSSMDRLLLMLFREQRMKIPSSLAFWRRSTLAADSIFDPAYYAEQCVERVELEEAKEHYRAVGSAQLLSPSPFFSCDWYAHITGLGRRSTEHLIAHYKAVGFRKGFNPHPLFDVNFYRRQFSLDGNVDPIAHYMSRVPHRSRWASPTPFFSVDFYLRSNGDVAKSNISPFEHYIKYGWREGRKPSAYFCPKWYLSRYQDVARAGVEPLQHFLTTGIYEGRSPHPLIDIEYYLAGAPDVAAAGVNPYEHFIVSGDREGRSPHPLFNPSFYRANGPSLGDAAPFAHYVEQGAQSLRSPCQAFDAHHYAVHYPNEADDPLYHLLLAFPQDVRRHFHPMIDGDYQLLTAKRSASGTHPLVDYAQFRSNFNVADVARCATGIPHPRRALLPQRSVVPSVQYAEPKVSIIIPCYKSNQSYLDACVNSVIAQSYKNWELILIDDGSPDDTTWPAIERHQARDIRIRAFRLMRNQGISAATNAAVEASDGELLAFVDHDDVIVPEAISAIVEGLLTHCADAAYSDQAFLDQNNVVDEPMLKPGWSPVLFSGVMYVGHLLVVRREIALKAGLFRSEFDGCQDYEFMLRVSEHTKRITHVPRILYHWRRSETSIAANADVKGKIEPLQAKAVAEHFARTGVNGAGVADNRVPHRLKLVPLSSNRPSVPVDVIVHGAADDLSIDALSKRIAAANGEVASLNLSSWSSPCASWVERGRARFVLFLDARTNFLNDAWLAHLVMHAERMDVAFVSPHVYLPSGQVVAAGLVASRNFGLLNAYEGAQDGQDGAVGSLFCDREVSAVGATCTLVARDRLSALGSLSDRYVSSEGTIRDASWRAALAGLRNISVASRLIEVPEGDRSDFLADAADGQFFLDTHRDTVALGDPFYNSNYVRDRADFSVGK